MGVKLYALGISNKNVMIILVKSAIDAYNHLPTMFYHYSINIVGKVITTSSFKSGYVSLKVYHMPYVPD